MASYAVLILAGPVLHHGFACHQTIPTHCPSCVASVAGPDLPSTATMAATALVDAGATPSTCRARACSAQVDAVSGRAPPVSSL
jgi:hypothetical protein